jgi:hypothetical protein
VALRDTWQRTTDVKDELGHLDAARGEQIAGDSSRRLRSRIERRTE